jgi:hypothetical protein
MRGSLIENQATTRGTLSYFGTYAVSEPNRMLTFHIESSSFPNLNDTDQKRVLTLASDDLKLETQLRPRGSATVGLAAGEISLNAAGMGGLTADRRDYSAATGAARRSRPWAFPFFALRWRCPTLGDHRNPVGRVERVSGGLAFPEIDADKRTAVRRDPIVFADQAGIPS